MNDGAEYGLRLPALGTFVLVEGTIFFLFPEKDIKQNLPPWALNGIRGSALPSFLVGM